MQLIMYIFLFVLLILKFSLGDIIINTNSTKSSRFQRFWRSTGFCPPDPKENISKYLVSDEQKVHLALIGSLPNKGITHVRVHWVLNLLKSRKGLHGFEKAYDFSDMDQFLSHLNNHSLMPGFEFMGSSNKLISFEKTESFWSDLVQTVIKRYIDKFGPKRVSKWRFETWNEPDLKGYNTLNFSLPEYLDYVRGCSKGLKAAFAGTGRKWQLGGPAGLFRDKGHPLCWGLLEACESPDTPGNHVPCPIQFVSFHRKGEGSAEGVLNGTFQLLDSIHNHFPRLRTMPIANDEADIEENWSRSLEWRGDCRYAAMVAKVIAGYYKSVRVERKLKIEVLSNDNAFLNYHPFYFTQRTLFARFQINTTSPRHGQFIKKPVYSLMALLSFLGDELLAEEATEPDSLLTTVATRGKPGKQSFVSVVLAYGNGTDIDKEKRRATNVVFTNLSECHRRFVLYRLDNIHTNPYEVWKTLGSPVFPSEYERRRMREVEEPQRLFNPRDIKNSTLNLTLELTSPSIYLIHLCCRTNEVPKKVHSLSIFNITFNEVLITWKYSHTFSRCLRTYEVEIQSKCTNFGRFKRVNQVDTIFLSFHHVGKGDRACERTRGNFRVRAVDYWDRPGEYSEIISYP